MRHLCYPSTLNENANVTEDVFSYIKALYVGNTYQFNDYSRYDFNLFSE